MEYLFIYVSLIYKLHPIVIRKNIFIFEKSTGQTKISPWLSSQRIEERPSFQIFKYWYY